MEKKFLRCLIFISWLKLDTFVLNWYFLYKVNFFVKSNDMEMKSFYNWKSMP